MKTLLNIFICSLLFTGNRLPGQTSTLIFEAKFKITLNSEEGVKADLYFLAKHEIGHAMVFEKSLLYKEAQERLGFVSPALTEYYQDTIVPLLPWLEA